jgi:hypothetical protein
MKHIKSDRGGTPEYAQHVGFKDGAHGVSAVAKQAEYSAMFEARKAQVIKQFTDLFARLRAACETKRLERQEADALWSRISEMTTGIQPPVLLYVIGLTIAALIAGVEPFFLAPVMDGLGIPNRVAQLLTASVLVITPAVIFEVSKYAYRRIGNYDDRTSRKTRYLAVAGTVALSALVLVYTISLGLWRAKELIYAGKLDPDGAGSFLTQSANETTVVFIALTVALPLALMFLLDHCLSKLSFAWTWRRARGNARTLVRQQESAEKALTAAEEEQDAELVSLDEEAEEFRQAYIHAYSQGISIGAWRQSAMVPITKTIAVLFAMLAICLVINQVIETLLNSGFMGSRLLISAFVTLSVTGVFGIRFFQSWSNPSARELVDQQATMFRNVRRFAVLSEAGSQSLLTGNSRYTLPAAVESNSATTSHAWEDPQ